MLDEMNDGLEALAAAGDFEGGFQCVASLGVFAGALVLTRPLITLAKRNVRVSSSSTLPVACNLITSFPFTQGGLLFQSMPCLCSIATFFLPM